MKIYSLEDIKAMSKKNEKYIEDYDEVQEQYSIEEFDKAKTRVLKYALYKKRSESEIKKKFSKEYDDNILDDIIEKLKESGYIDDKNYILRAVDEFIALRNMSIKEMKYKLLAKGIKSSDIEDYISDNEEKLIEYELKSAQHIVDKKKNQMEEKDIKIYLMKKGYREESIKEAL